ncbi:MAG: hypothetical protein KDD67_07780 [Ignavibacteriae bacterium]|nr:hypothetical protein [Ignavibacteriota bacterium]MCB9215896.1 hypothetical protein [Ignavibacteria bacterium]
MNNSRLVWSSDGGDLRKKRAGGTSTVDESTLQLKVRRLTSGKGRTVIEITGLPRNKSWCKDLASQLKKGLGTGGAYKDDFIEIHGEKLEQVTSMLDDRSLKWKKTGG